MNKKEARVSTKIRVVPSRHALYHLLANGGFEQIEFIRLPGCGVKTVKAPGAA